MKTISRKLSWLLVLAMLFSLCATAVFALEGDALTVRWKDEAPEGVTEVRLDLYSGENKVNEADKYLTLKKEDGTWTASYEGVALHGAENVLYTPKFAEGTPEALNGYEVKLTRNDDGLILSFEKKQPEVKPETSPETSPVTSPVASTEPQPEASPETSPVTSPVVSPETSPEVSQNPPEIPPETSPTNPTGGEKMSLTVNVAWVDGDNQDGIRPSEMAVKLTDGTNVVEGTLKADAGWIYTFTDLPKGSWIAEVGTVTGYTADISAVTDGVITVTQTHATDKRDYTVKAIWDDGNDLLKKRPSSITVQLYKVIEDNNSVNVGEPAVIKADDKGEWSHTFTGLDKNYKGNAADYRFKLVYDVEGYSVTRDFAQGTIKLKNNYTDYAKVDVNVTAKWVDNNNKYTKRPASITVYLYQDSVQYKTVKVSADKNGNWTCSFEDLPAYKDGKAVTYTVKQGAVTDYVTKIASSTKDDVVTVTITNTYKNIPLTGDETQLVFWMVLVMVAASGLGYALVYRRHYN